MGIESGIQVPTEVVKAVIKRWPERGPAWADGVRKELASLCTKYRAVPTATFDARFSFVVEVAVDDHHLVMRSTPDPHGGDQAAVSVALAGLGIAPRVYEVAETDTGTWTVMDRISPGSTLVDRPASLTELVGLLGPMARQPAPRTDMVSIADWLGHRLEDDNLEERAPGRNIAPLSERRKASDLIKGLARDWTPTLCHGDVSSKNVLASGDGRLLLIDPRGVSGEIEYDIAVVASKLARRYGTADRTSELAKLLGADPDRALAWRAVAHAARV